MVDIKYPLLIYLVRLSFLLLLAGTQIYTSIAVLVLRVAAAAHLGQQKDFLLLKVVSSLQPDGF